MNSPYRASAIPLSPRWGATKRVKLALRSHRTFIKTTKKMKNFIKEEWGAMLVVTLLVGVIAAMVWAVFAIYAEEKAKEEKNLHAPCQVFFGETMDKVPARCIKEYLKEEMKD